VEPLISSSSPSCTESSGNKFTAEKSFVAEQIASEIYFFSRQIAFLISLILIYEDRYISDN
jgi:hypothetical protein